MAGVKITDLGTLTTALNEDLLYIVDVNDTTQSPQGTSKQIEVGNLFESGTFDPKTTEISGLTSINSYNGIYYKIGSIISGSFIVVLELSSASGSYNFELPIPTASVFLTGKQVNFAVSCNTPLDEFTEYNIQSETGTNQIIVNVTGTTSVDLTMNIIFMYNEDI
jgi:hypothetical protein